MFHYSNHILHAEDVAVAELAAQYGTPLYIYSASQITQNYQKLSDALTATGLKTTMHFAVKANYNLAVLHHLKNLGAGADVVSGGEMQRALAAGMTADHIIFSGVAKTDAELRAALAAGICQINLESAEELKHLQQIAAAMNIQVDCAVRINPDVDANTHAKINTGKSEHKFGVDIETACQMFNTAKGSAVNLRGIATHIGSQLLDLQPFDDAFAVMASFMRELQQAGHTVDVCDIGGGIGVPYQSHEKSIDLGLFTQLLKKHFAGFGGTLASEPGRFLVANAGVLLTRVEFIKRTAHKTFVIVDAAMNDLMRPAMYDAYHPIDPVQQTSAATMACDIVGGICETSDIFAAARQLPENLKSGDLLAIGMAGAYGSTMSNTYNARNLVAEVMVNGVHHGICRERWDIQAQMQLDKIPSWMK
ncbi:MAG TPA: diaminopimelate decarboxylase [Alphaproteobacteria bacterium]|nr:diaminopimelate decarboxylase [Rhodospirillaceae bacterium]HRJ12163.1 diaminopimelate decarboxylase [Alphaproteobacteria bacterium]